MLGGTPDAEARLPYYRALFLSWTDGDPGDNRDWDEVLDAVARES